MELTSKIVCNFVQICLSILYSLYLTSDDVDRGASQLSVGGSTGVPSTVSLSDLIYKESACYFMAILLIFRVDDRDASPRRSIIYCLVTVIPEEIVRSLPCVPHHTGQVEGAPQLHVNLGSTHDLGPGLFGFLLQGVE